MEREFPALAKLLAEIARLNEGYELLEKIWLEVGPYQQDKVTPETWRKVNDYFHFDDSE